MEKRLKKHLKDGKFDNVSKQRSKVMSSIRGKHNRSTEICLKMALVRSGINGWKLHSQKLPGTPDFYFHSPKLAVFVDGCFWHGCPKCGHIPKTRSEFWEAKIKRTKQRDRKKRSELRKIGISTLGVWEHELKESSGVDKVIKKIERKIKKLLSPFEAI
ncbi:very short patch repair endonuclease [Candidatus Pacearchaeota archaeon]|nr:very short patch repair endonuclease [Candidatus Pacearchaeota archaeon]